MGRERTDWLLRFRLAVLTGPIHARGDPNAC